MFRLEERQLHVLLGLLCVASILMFCIFGISRNSASDIKNELSGMENFSEAWVCTYTTNDADKLKEYQKTQSNTGKMKSNMITEIVNLPVSIPADKENSVTLTHKLPEIDSDKIYLTIQTEQQNIKVLVENDVLYSSLDADGKVSAYHVIPVPAQYKNKVASIELQGTGSGQMQIGAIGVGNYNEVVVQAIQENTSFLVIGILLIGISISLFGVWILVKNTWKQKKLLLYAVMEGLSLGVLLFADGRFIQILTGWNYSIYLIRTCLVIFTAVLHLIIIRCFTNKKKVLFLIDAGILFYGIFYISVMVLQAFSLITFAGAYRAGYILFGIIILMYTIVLLVAVYEYKQKEARIVFFANVFLLLCIAVQIFVKIFKIQNSVDSIYISCGILFYMIILQVFGLKKSFYVRTEKNESEYSEEILRKQIIEELNPNLLFASFHTLQNLIKNGSSKSVKMIYYISVYMRDNLKAISQAGEIIPFEEEMEHIVAYLQLQKTRNQNLDFVIECKVKEFRVPRNSIEPLVEKAVKYGIGGHGNRGNIVLRSYQREEGYAIQVIDDGIGFDKSSLKQRDTKSMLNLFAMLEKNCEAKTELITKEGKGTVITVVFPMLENDLLEE